MLIVDHTHCGRHVTGLERITLELFSAQALAPLEARLVTARGRAEMMLKQNIVLPALAARHRSALMLCPGFPPAFGLTPFGERVIPYIHDLFLITRRDDLNTRGRLYMAEPFAFAVKRLTRFMANSQTTAGGLRRHCRADADIRLSRPVSRNVFGLTAEGRADRLVKEGALRLLALGTIEPRKNLVAAAAIVGALRARGFPNATLEVAGREGWGGVTETLRGLPGVTMHGYLPAADVRALAASCDLLIMASHDEGLGLPLLEAQYGGLPVLAPRKAVFAEVTGQSGALIDTADPAGAAEQIAGMVAEPGWRARHAASAAANLARWNAAAEEDHAGILAWLGGLVAMQERG